MDIDGLRAIAVLAVICFHAWPEALSGGFSGVDVFFVISGYLISSLIISDLKSHKFKFLDFYSRRIVRIFPSLLVVLLACFVGGWFILLANEYRLLGKHIAAGAGFVSNFVYLAESGYFDKTAATKPLLHLWSLGIEEQFYIFWPLLLWIVWKARIGFMRFISVLAAASFVLNIYKVRTQGEFAFYSPETRFWELLLGSILAHYEIYKGELLHQIRVSYAHLLSIMGAALILTGFYKITNEGSYPGYQALLPTLGALFLILGGPEGWINQKVLSHRFLVFVGLMSYPLYLWHWPLMAAAHILKSWDRETRIEAVYASFFLAWLTYVLVEKPIRFGKVSRLKPGILALLMLLMGALGYLCMKMEGFKGYGFRTMDKVEYLNYFENSPPNWTYSKSTLSEKYRFDCGFWDVKQFESGRTTKIPLQAISQDCYKRLSNKRHVLLIWGDSHAQQLYHGLVNNLPQDWQVLMVASSSCPPDIWVTEDSAVDYCQRSNWFALKTIREVRPDAVIAAQFEGQDPEKMQALATGLISAGAKKVVIAGPTPYWEISLPSIVARDFWQNTPERSFVGIRKDILLKNTRLIQVVKDAKDFVYADLVGFFCNRSGCLVRIGPDKKEGIVDWDEHHLTPLASDYLAKNYLTRLVLGEKF